MAPVAHPDIDMESHTSGQDSPLRRQFSEPMHLHSASTQASPSPSPVMHKTKCDWCGEYFESLDDDVAQDEALKEHIATVHPHIAKFAMYDGAADDEAEDSHLDYGDELHDESEGDEADAIDEDDIAAEDAEDAEEDEAAMAAYATYDGATDAVEVGEAAFDAVEQDHDDVDGEQPEDSELALSNQLHEFSREEDSITVEKRLHKLWSIHDASHFSKDYDEKTAHLEESWDNVFRDPKRVKKRGVIEILERPVPYKKAKVAKGEYLEITAAEQFLAQLRDPENRSVDELYAITENVAHALKAWQDEYLEIDRLHRNATRHPAKTAPANPRKLDRPEVFQDKKESLLYGYKHDPKEDKVRNQDAFYQGGFKPTTALGRKMLIKAGNDPNPDGWRPIKRFGVNHVPMFQNPPREEVIPKATRKRKAAEMEAANKSAEADETEEAPNAPEIEEPTPKRRTRNRRVDIEEKEPTPVPAPVISTRGSGRGRGRGRGRGGSRVPSRAASEIPQLVAPVTPAAPARSTVRGGRGASSAKSTTTHTLSHAHPAPAPSDMSQSPAFEPALSPSAEPIPPMQMGSTQSSDAMDPVERARREKIANSKNPKRTEAMLNHWARFNREGRIRNPKRTKTQIEEARAAEAAKKATEPPKTAGRKKSVTSGQLRPIDAGIAPAPAPTPLPAPSAPSFSPMPPPAPASLHPGPHPSHPQLAPIPPPGRGSMAPYAPIDPRAVAPFPPVHPSPYGPLQQQPPQIPYQTPYPEQYLPFGAAAAAGGLPPPGHPRP